MHKGKVSIHPCKMNELPICCEDIMVKERIVRLVVHRVDVSCFYNIGNEDKSQGLVFLMGGRFFEENRNYSWKQVENLTQCIRVN